jgi:hypothetical protein
MGNRRDNGQGKSGGGCLKTLLILVVLGVLGLVGVVALGGKMASDIQQQKKSDQEAAKSAPLSDLQWKDLEADFGVLSKKTDLQKKEIWKGSGYEGQKVRWSGKVGNVHEMLGSLHLRMEIPSLNPLLTSTISVALDDSEREKALGLSDGDSVVIEGVIKDYSNVFPGIDLKHGVIVSP